MSDDDKSPRHLIMKRLEDYDACGGVDEMTTDFTVLLCESDEAVGFGFDPRGQMIILLVESSSERACMTSLGEGAVRALRDACDRALRAATLRTKA